MMTTEQLSTTGWLILKGLSIIGLVLYAIYAWVIVRQEQLMSHVFAASSEAILRILALAHLGAAIFLIFLALILL